MSFHSRALALACTLFASAPLFAASELGTAPDFRTLLTIAASIGRPTETLVVMDDDDTLTMMSCPDRSNLETCQYLGGPAWFDWQNELIQTMAQPRVADDFDDLLRVAGLLLAMNYMPYTASDVPDVLGELHARGVRLITATARGTDTVSATEGQFARLPTPVVASPTLLALMRDAGLAFAGDSSLPSPFQPCPDAPLARAITYQQGVAYVSGQNKGTVLKCVLDRHNAQAGVTPVRQVIFIDDTSRNVKQVAEAFADDDRYRVHALHYSALEAHKAALTKGELAARHQRKAAERWALIRDALRLNLQNPTLP